MTDPVQPADDLDELRADLARFVLREAGQAVSKDPELPLSSALTQAIHLEAEKAARRNQDMLPTPDALANSVMEALRPQLSDVVRAAVQQNPDALARRKGRNAGLSVPVAAAIAVGAALLAFAAGFGVSRLVTPEAEPAVVPAPTTSTAPPVTTATPPLEAGDPIVPPVDTASPTQNGSTGPTP